MQPETEGNEEKGPNHVPYINDPGKRPHPDGGSPRDGEPEITDANGESLDNDDNVAG
ncbi:hypothetical protein J3P77_10430 [Pseudomonas sp. R1-18]|uniref:hypothetical protein n=1 Tax=Pseudomonas sp. R1-18 TaxID=1632772 RepID=UPI003DA9C92D